MTAAIDMQAILALPSREKIAVAEAIWESISEADVPLTEAQQAELERRLEIYRANLATGRPYQEVCDRITARLQTKS